MILMIMTKNSSNTTLDFDSYDYFKNNDVLKYFYFKN